MKLAVISYETSDFSDILKSAETIDTTLIKPGSVSSYDLEEFDAFCILGGTQEKALVLIPPERRLLEEQLLKGKRFFTEFILSFGMVYSAPPVSTRYSRLVSAGGTKAVPAGKIMDDQTNQYSHPYFVEKNAYPILVYKDRPATHSFYDLDKTEIENHNKWAIWQENKNLMMCGFRLCNFNKARFAPAADWKSLIKLIISWLCSCDSSVFTFPAPIYYVNQINQTGSLDEQICSAVKKGLEWYTAANILIDNGCGGVYEGLGTEIDPLGRQRAATDLRADCCAETGMAYYFEYLRTGNKEYLEISDNLENYCFDNFYQSDGQNAGFIRWTEIAWQVCYQDDAARMLIPTLYKAIYSGTDKYIPQVKKALRFLMELTGTDGLMGYRIDAIFLDDEKRNELASKPAGFCSAHYNAYYSAALLLCGMICSDNEMIKTGEKGLESIMSVYPDTAREQSETQEMCRLVFPLSMLYKATGKELHRSWLYRVADDLEKTLHPGGAYLEWDTGYQAARSRGGDGEASMLNENGDPVVDMLYSLNWLPMGFIQAYLVTGDEKFKILWYRITGFLLKSQINSCDKNINGAWTRGFDVDLMEIFGNSNDEGWGTWAIESGWTMGEIISGLSLGCIADKYKQLYK